MSSDFSCNTEKLHGCKSGGKKQQPEFTINHNHPDNLFPLNAIECYGFVTVILFVLTKMTGMSNERSVTNAQPANRNSSGLKEVDS